MDRYDPIKYAWAQELIRAKKYNDYRYIDIQDFYNKKLFTHPLPETSIEKFKNRDVINLYFRLI